MRYAVFVLLLASGCTLVVGTDPRHVAIDGGDADDAGISASGPDAGVPVEDAAPPPVDAGADHEAGCDIAGCSAAEASCKASCEDAASACLASCGGGTSDDEKSCASACAKQEQHCAGTCVTTCNACVKGCGPPCPP